MTIRLCKIDNTLRPLCREIFNQIIEEGASYPWDSPLTKRDFDAIFLPSEPVWCAVDELGSLGGFAHIHPNGIGRTSHIANCGYAVAKDFRGRGIGKMLVAKSIEVARSLGFKGIQFNAVVATNAVAIKLYESFGFRIIGTIPCGFRLGGKDASEYAGKHIMYLEL